MPLLLTSTAFQEGQPIPRDYSAAGGNVSPPLKWPDPPEGSKSFALVCEDLDAGPEPATHWLIFNMSGEEWELSPGVPPEEGLPNGVVQGANDFGGIGYAGPAAPAGSPHRYRFTLFALDRRLDLPGGTRKADLLAALKGHGLAEARLTATFAPDQGPEIPADPQVRQMLQQRGAIHTAPLE